MSVPRRKFSYSELYWSAFFPHFPAFDLNKEKYSALIGLHVLTPIDFVIYFFIKRKEKMQSNYRKKVKLQEALAALGVT